MSIEQAQVPEPNIIGYRKLTAEEITMINTLKELANVIRGTVDKMARDPDIDPRWVSIARTHLQQGFMALTRAVAKPEGF